MSETSSTSTRARDMRIMLVEDHPIVRLGLETLISAQRDMCVVAEAAGASEAVRLAEELRPDLVILALRLEGELVGVEVCRAIKNLDTAPAVLVYTAFNSEADVASSFLSGADGYVYKGAASARLLSSIHDTLDGRRAWVPAVETTDPVARLRHAVETSGLTPRELEVLGLMLQHFTNSQIVKELYIQLPTVKTHVSSILRKLNLSSRQDLFWTSSSTPPGPTSA